MDIQDSVETSQITDHLLHHATIYRTYVERTNDLIYCINIDGYLEYANPALLTTLGYSLLIEEQDMGNTTKGTSTVIIRHHAAGVTKAY